MISSARRVILAYKNFAANRNISHIGLGVAAMNTAKVLRQHGLAVDVFPIVNAAELETRLGPDVSHVVVSAPWIPTAEWQRIVQRHTDVHFAVNCHSNVGFLHADANGVKLVREAMDVERGTWNFHVAGNSLKFCRWVADTYRTPCQFLPNLYYLDPVPLPRRPIFSGGLLRIGAFGATRPLKNFMSAAGAAVEVAAQLHAELELWVSAGRTEGVAAYLDAVRSMIGGLPNIRLVESGWQSWPQFRITVRHMHLLLQPSYTESFNMVTADGIAEGVPSVVSEAIDWAPGHWKAPCEDVHQMARVARYLLSDPHAPADGLLALQRHNRDGLDAWTQFLAR